MLGSVPRNKQMNSATSPACALSECCVPLETKFCETKAAGPLRCCSIVWLRTLLRLSVLAHGRTPITHYCLRICCMHLHPSMVRDPLSQSCMAISLVFRLQPPRFVSGTLAVLAFNIPLQ